VALIEPQTAVASSCLLGPIHCHTVSLYANSSTFGCVNFLDDMIATDQVT